MTDKVTVIVPVYNVEKYLEKCVKSVLNQTYTNLEIILINDGSTDRSGTICEELSKIDSRINVLSINNSGVSFARNYGIEHSTGEYIVFVDSDDYVSEYMIEFLYKNLKNKNADFSVGKVEHIYVDTNHNTSNLNLENIDVSIWNSREALREFMNTNKTSFFPVAKMFRKNLFENFKFNSNYKLAEDALLISEILLEKDRKVVFFDYPIYFYVHRENSATTTVNSSVFDTITVYSEILPKIENKYPELKNEILNRKYWSYFTVLDKIIFDRKKYKNEIKNIRKNILKGFLTIIRDSNFRFNRKISLFALLISTSAYESLVRLNKNR